MLRLVSLIAVSALVQLQFSIIDGHVIDVPKFSLNNEMISNAPKHSLTRGLVRITTPPPATIGFTPGVPLVLECEIAANHPPTARWMKNGRLIFDYEEETNEIITTETEWLLHLTIKLVVTNAMDGDVFTCVAISSFKETRASTTVFIENDKTSDMISDAEAEKPVIVAYYNSVIQNQDTSVTLPCRVHSRDQYHLLWMDNTNHIVFENSRVKVLPTGDLQISNLEWSDMGGYTCVVKTMYGKDSANTFIYPTKP